MHSLTRFALRSVAVVVTACACGQAAADNVIGNALTRMLQSFHGVVIDQHGEPVVGAQVRYAFWHRGKAGTALTDMRGHFELEPDSAGLRHLTIEDITHPEISDFSFPSFPERPGLKVNQDAISKHLNFWSSRAADAAGALVWREWTRENPFVFKAWRLTQPEHVIAGRGGSFPKPDASVHTVDLEKRDRHMSIAGKGPGQFRVSCTRSPATGQAIVLNAIDGGFVEVPDDLYLNLAPEDGYQASLAIVGATEGRRYYFVANGGAEFGSLFLRVPPDVGQDECVLDFTYKMNPGGSRKLERPGPMQQNPGLCRRMHCGRLYRDLDESDEQWKKRRAEQQRRCEASNCRSAIR